MSKLTCEEAKKLNIVKILASMNIHPVRKSKSDYWYLSPIHQESEASFKVSDVLNLWYDHSIGKGGNLIDLLMFIYNCNVSEVLERLSNQRLEIRILPKTKEVESNNLIIKQIQEISNIGLINYIKFRAVDLKIVKRFAKEVDYLVNNRVYKAIGIPTIEIDGYELATPMGEKSFKNSTSPKNISYFKLNKPEIAVFEGMFDWWSLWVHNYILAEKCDFIILNSLSFKNNAVDLLINYDKIHFFLDNDTNNAGQAATGFYLGMNLNKALDHSNEYKKSKDLNDHIRGIFKDNSKNNDLQPPDQSISPKPKIPPIIKPKRGMSMGM
jgi:hypothetical protein